MLAKEACRKIHSLPASLVLSVFVTSSVGHGTVPGTEHQLWLNSMSAFWVGFSRNLDDTWSMNSSSAQRQILLLED